MSARVPANENAHARKLHSRIPVIQQRAEVDPNAAGFQESVKRLEIVDEISSLPIAQSEVSDETKERSKKKRLARYR